MAGLVSIPLAVAVPVLLVVAAAAENVQLGYPGSARVPERVSVSGRDYETGAKTCSKPPRRRARVARLWTIVDRPKAIVADRRSARDSVPTEVWVERGPGCAVPYSLLGAP